MPRSRFAVPALFCLGLISAACNAANTAPAAKLDDAHAYHLAERVESAAPPAAVGGDEHAACGAAEGACGASCGQESAANAACGGGEQAAAQAPTSAQDSTELTRVDPSQVCMVRNHFIGRPQLAVEAEGSTYYGCCAGCATRLFKDAQARQAIDPVSHNPVDKSLAVLGKTARGNVLYFENEANFEAFRSAPVLSP